jgi:hypothetical protein
MFVDSLTEHSRCVHYQVWSTPFCLISVGCHLEAHIAITFYREYYFLPNSISSLDMIFSVTISNCLAQQKL